MSPFEWKISGESILFRPGPDGVWRPHDAPDLRARAWVVTDGYRASISNGRVIKISRRHGVPQEALRECAQYFQALAA